MEYDSESDLSKCSTSISSEDNDDLNTAFALDSSFTNLADLEDLADHTDHDDSSPFEVLGAQDDWRMCDKEVLHEIFVDHTMSVDETSCPTPDLLEYHVAELSDLQDFWGVKSQ